MQLNHVIVTLCLLGTVALCRGKSTASPEASAFPEPSALPEASALPETTAQSEATTQSGAPTIKPTDRPDATSPAGVISTVPSSQATEGSNTPGPDTDPTAPVGEDSSTGLSSGAIAGITIGSIAGVAAVGGGIFGALKYTGRI